MFFLYRIGFSEKPVFLFWLNWKFVLIVYSDSFVERNFEESRTTRRHHSPEPTKSVARELVSTYIH